MGSWRTRLPVAWNTAFDTAAAVPTLPSSPRPFTPGRVHFRVDLGDHDHLQLVDVGVDLQQVFGEVVVHVARTAAKAPTSRGTRISRACIPFSNR